MSKFEEAVSRVMESTMSTEDDIMSFIDECIGKFIEQIKEGVGYIIEDDVMRQFNGMFPGFENEIFNQEELENYVVTKLDEEGLIKNMDEINPDEM